MQFRQRRRRRQVPSLNLASMPDLIFTVLFFFMIVTHMRTETVKVKVEVPQGTEVTKLQNKRTAINLYIGTAANGIVSVQVADKICTIDQAAASVQSYWSNLPDSEKPSMTVNLKADRTVPMGIITDLKKKICQSGSITIHYSATEEKNTPKQE